MVLSAVAYVQNARIIEWVDQVDWLKRARHGLARRLSPWVLPYCWGWSVLCYLGKSAHTESPVPEPWRGKAW